MVIAYWILMGTPAPYLLGFTQRDTKACPDKAIKTLYLRRWTVELCFRDIKTTLGLGVLRCQSPELIKREIWLQVLAYNPVRALMLEGAWTHFVKLERPSLKAPSTPCAEGLPDVCLQACPPETTAHHRGRSVLNRANRSEPRARKHRLQLYQPLTRPRNKMVISPSLLSKITLHDYLSAIRL